MGEARNEVSGFRKAGDHPAGRAICAGNPYLEAFPLIAEGPKFAALVADIKLHGLWNPIMLTHDRRVLVDGRRRYLACLEATSDPVFECLGADYTDEMIRDFIISQNAHRRNLNSGQLAFVALDIKNVEAEPDGRK